MSIPYSFGVNIGTAGPFFEILGTIVVTIFNAREAVFFWHISSWLYVYWESPRSL
jgi:hypothetical protein